jgi:hypothetical protein
MTEARPLVEPYLPDCGIERIALAIATGYQHTNELMLSSLALSTFPVGMEQRPYILRGMIDFELRKIADATKDFNAEVKWNAAHNCRSLHLYRDRLAITQHYMGRKNFRQQARNAKSRAPLAARNLSFDFEDEAETRELFKGDGYIQFLHGGGAKPQFIALVIPTEDQEIHRARSVIDVPEVQSTTAPEEIVEQLGFVLRDTIFNEVVDNNEEEVTNESNDRNQARG